MYFEYLGAMRSHLPEMGWMSAAAAAAAAVCFAVCFVIMQMKRLTIVLFASSLPVQHEDFLLALKVNEDEYKQVGSSVMASFCSVFYATPDQNCPVLVNMETYNTQLPKHCGWDAKSWHYGNWKKKKKILDTLKIFHGPFYGSVWNIWPDVWFLFW